MHSISFTYSHVILILQLPRNILSNYRHKWEELKDFCPSSPYPDAQGTKQQNYYSLSHDQSPVMWPPHAQKVTHILWNCHWCNTKAGTPLGSLLLLWVLTRHTSHLWNWPGQFPPFSQDDTMSISNSAFCLSDSPSHRTSTYWLSQPQESSMQALPEWGWVCFSDQRVVRLENFFPKSIQGNVMVKSNAVWIDFIKEFNLFFFMYF